MSLVTVKNLSKSFGVNDLFAFLSFGIEKRDRVGIVGSNGVGKSTLLKILARIEDPSSGDVHISRGLTIGYLPQESDLTFDRSLYLFCEEVFSSLIQKGQELQTYQENLGNNPDESSLRKLGELQHEYETNGGYNYTNNIQRVLFGLGFSNIDLQTPFNRLSGGQKTRATLARLLLADPALLLLDEPTNHLDMEAVSWLEGYLANWEGAAVIVSHDRYFLDKTVNNILEMAPIGTETYSGNYSHYLVQRQQRWERRKEVFEREKEKLYKELEYIKKNISGQNTLQAKGKLKRLTRLVQAVEQVGMEAVMNSSWSELDVETTTSPFSVDEAERRINSLRLPKSQPPVIHLNLKADRRSGEIVLRAKGAAVGWDGKPLFSVPELELMRKECAALIGPNGAGKSTFLKTLLGQIPPINGSVQFGASLDVGYFAQAHEGLNPANTLIKEIQTIAIDMSDNEARQYLGKYLFSGDDAYKLVEVLSGGERGRLALAKLALFHTNLLLLDEPSNHLDIPAQEMLEQVLEAYPGTIILVSHDRYLIDALATQIWEIDPATGSLVIFKGGYAEYALAKQTSANLNNSNTTATSNIKPTEPKPPEKKASTNMERKRQAEIIKLEAEIQSLEIRHAEIQNLLNGTGISTDEVITLGLEFEKITHLLDQKMDDWTNLQQPS